MNIVTQIRKELKNNKQKTRVEAQYFYKEKVKSYNLQIPVVRQIAKNYWLEIKDLSKMKILKLCEELLKSGYIEESTIAFSWSFNLKKQYDENDFKIFESWINKYIDNWGKCDDFCTHTMGEYLLQYPKYLKKLPVWAKSKNMWVRRAAAVSLIYPNRYKSHLKEIFNIADILLLDKEDLVQKAYGWLLKEASNKYPKEVFAYVMKHKAKMPRTALRYAIEKYPKAQRLKAMQ